MVMAQAMFCEPIIIITTKTTTIPIIQFISFTHHAYHIHSGSL